MLVAALLITCAINATTVFVEGLEEKAVEFEIVPITKTAMLKENIEKGYGIPIIEQSLSVNGKLLKDNVILSKVLSSTTDKITFVRRTNKLVLTYSEDSSMYNGALEINLPEEVRLEGTYTLKFNSVVFDNDVKANNTTTALLLLSSSYKFISLFEQQTFEANSEIFNLSQEYPVVAKTTNPNTPIAFTFTPINEDCPKEITMYYTTMDVSVHNTDDIHRYFVRGSAEPLKGGEIKGTGVYNAGDTVTLTATAQKGAKFISWEDGLTTAERSLVVDKSCVFKAIFEILERYKLVLDVNNLEYGTVTGGGTYYDGDTATVTAVANEGYRFVKWGDGVKDAERSVSVSCDSVIIANFEEIPKYTLSINMNDAAMGSVEGFGVYELNETVTLRAVANEGFKFVGWSDDVNDAEREVVMSSDIELTANFDAVEKFIISLSSSNENLGYVRGSGEYAKGDVVTINAVAEDNARFVSWSDGNTDVIRKITVTENLSLTATFESVKPITNINECKSQQITVRDGVIIIDNVEAQYVINLCGQTINNANLKTGVYIVPTNNSYKRVVVQ